MINARVYGNQLLYRIRQASLTDAEAVGLPEEVADDDVAVAVVYNHLVKVLNGRGGIGDGIARLNAMALESGIDLNAKQERRSEIFIGGVLE